MIGTPEEIAELFTRDDGAYVFGRWGRPLAPVVFGVEDKTIAVIRSAFEAVATLTGHELAETDPELGANCMVFFCRAWAELSGVPNLDRMIPLLSSLVARLEAEGATQYRAFRFDENGAVRAAFVFLRMDDQLRAQPAGALALAQVAQVILLWSARAFRDRSPLAVAGRTHVLRPEIAAVIRAAYAPVLPSACRDRSHALRLFARLEAAR